MENPKLKAVQAQIAAMEKASKISVGALQEVVENRRNEPLARAIAGAALAMFAEAKLDNLRKEESHLSAYQPPLKGREAARR